MNKLVLCLLVFCFQQGIAQKSGLKFNNQLDYKLELIEQDITELVEVPNCPNCTSIGGCLLYFQGNLDEEQQNSLFQRLKEMANRFIAKDKVLVLTYGTDGNGGLGWANLDKETKRYNYIFVSVGSSCQVGNVPEAIDIFNETSLKYLDLRYGESWRDHLLEVLKKKGYSKDFN